jgi:sec-independent protein translocase protein TatC
MPRPRPLDDPDAYRMTFGEHLDELRVRLVLGLVGFAVAFIFCLSVVRDWVFQFLCRPLLKVMHDYELNPQLYDRGTGEAFGVYLKLSAIAATVIASPWLLYQLWKFISAGLYPEERKVVTKHLPLFVTLLFGGAGFAFYVVLPLTLQFLIAFTVSVPLPKDYEPITMGTVFPTTLPTIPALAGDPPQPIPDGAQWFNTTQSRLKVAFGGRIRTVQYTSENLVAPHIELGEYCDMLLLMLLTFALSFQTPLIVMLLVRMGIFPLEELQKMRRIVYFVIVILAAVITPGDAITATVALMLPLAALYELGLILARNKSAPQIIDPAP